MNYERFTIYSLYKLVSTTLISIVHIYITNNTINTCRMYIFQHTPLIYDVRYLIVGFNFTILIASMCLSNAVDVTALVPISATIRSVGW